MPFTPVLRKRQICGILLVEYLLGITLCVVVFLYATFDLTLRSPLRLYLERLLGGVTLYSVALVVTLLLVRMLHVHEGRKAKQFVPHQRTWEIFKGAFLGRESLLHDLRIVNSLALLFLLFLQLKNLIPFINSYNFDDILVRTESRLFGGYLAAEVLQNYLGVAIAPLLSGLYTGFFPYLAILTNVMIIQRNRDLTHEFLLGFAVLWLGSILLIYIFPTVGPCFVYPSLYQDLPVTEVWQLQDNLLFQRELLERDRNKGMYLISGLPSLHFAAVCIGTFYLRRVSRVLALFSGIFALFTAVTTIYFGWHYIVDDAVGLLIAVAAYRWVRRYFSPVYVYSVLQ